MSKYSIEIHFKETKDKVLDELTALLYVMGYDEVDVIGAPHLNQLYVIADLLEGEQCLLCCSHSPLNVEIAASISKTLACDAIYGHSNDGADNWRWIAFSQGEKKGEYWYLGKEGQEWVADPERFTPNSLTLYEAFDRYSCGYKHLTIKEAVLLDPKSVIIYGTRPE